MPASPETSEVVCYTRPDIFAHTTSTTQVLPYERIVGARILGEVQVLAMIDGESATGERPLRLPVDMANRLLHAIGVINRYSGLGVMNCHYFSRIVSGAPEVGLRASWGPVTHKIGELSPASTIDLGRIGLIGFGAHEAAHSLVGLGDDSPDSLQSLSGGEELAFADNDEVVGHL